MIGVPIPVSLLKEGMVIHSDIYRSGQLLLSKGQILSQKVIDQLLSRDITEIYVTKEQSDEIIKNLSPNSVEEDEETSNDRIFSKIMQNLYEKVELKPAVPKELIDKTNESVNDTYTKLWAGQEPELEPLRNNVNEMIEFLLSKTNAAPKLDQLCGLDEYTFVHSTNVCIILTVTLLELFPKSAIKEIAFAALLHDIGKTKIPLEIINKTESLTDEELKIFKKHPVEGVMILKDLNFKISENSLKVILEHHERYDGLGYPYGKKDKEISMQSYIAGVCDVYDELTTKRKNRNALPFPKAIQSIIKGAGSQFHPFVIDIFLDKIGFYPLGSVVKLSTNELAVVVELSKNRFRPVLKIVKDIDGQEMNPCKPISLIDDESYRITQSLSINEVCQEVS